MKSCDIISYPDSKCALTTELLDSRSVQPVQVPNFQLSDNDILRIAHMTKEVLKEEISTMVRLEVNKATCEMSDQLTRLSEEVGHCETEKQKA